MKKGTAIGIPLIGFVSSRFLFRASSQALSNSLRSFQTSGQLLST